jgi:glycosyltransferase involved in cell wall biosynthesis
VSEIAAVILTLNEERNIEECVQSVQWADRVVVLDTESTDDTVPLARSAGAEIMIHRFEDYSQIRNVALDGIDSPWVFFVDADERATPELANEIRRVTTERPENGWWVPRHNYLFGKLTLGAGWYPDYQMRLLRHGTARYERPVHEIVVLEGGAGYLVNPLLHYNYENVAQFHAKQTRYSDYDARTLFEEGVRPRFYTPITQPVRHFLWRFFTLRGFQDGVHGLRLCALTAWYEGTKYRRLAHLWAEQESLQD